MDSSAAVRCIGSNVACRRHARREDARGVDSRRFHRIVMGATLGYIAPMGLRDQVESLLPDWERWYPSLFDAASDLGLIRAEICDPNSLLLTRRHAKVRQRAEDAHREKWGGKEQ